MGRSGRARAAAVGWLGALFVIDDRWTGFYEGGAAALAALALVVVLAGTTTSGVSRAMSFAPLVSLGVISYGVYLWHWPVLLMVRRSAWTGAGADLAVVAITLAVSVASYRLVEAPIRTSRGWTRHMSVGWRPLGAAAMSIGVAAGVVVVMTRTSAPAEAVTVEEVLETIVTTTSVPDADIADAERGVGDETAAAVAPRPTTVVLIGDSTAWTLGGGLVGYRPDHGPYTSPFADDQIALVNLSRKGYRLAPGTTTQFAISRERLSSDIDDEAWWRETVVTVQPDLVIALFGLSDLQNREVDGVDIAFGSEAFDALMAAAAEEMLGGIAELAPVVVLTVPPYIGTDMARGEMAAFFSEFGASRTAHLNALLNEAVRDNPDISVLDFADLLCPGGDGPGLRDGCLLLASGEPVRFDGMHFSPEGARFAAALLTEPLVRAADGAAAS